MRNERLEYLKKMSDWFRRVAAEWENYKAVDATGDQEAVQQAERQMDELMEEYKGFGPEPNSDGEIGH